jgi:hypothetical protein
MIATAALIGDSNLQTTLILTVVFLLPVFTFLVMWRR